MKYNKVIVCAAALAETNAVKVNSNEQLVADMSLSTEM